MPGTIGGGSVIRGRNSSSVRNSRFSPAKIETLEHVGGIRTVVTFDVVARDGAFTDTTIANYSFRGQGSSIARYLLNEGAKRTPNFLKGELTTQFDGITPKTLSFDIIMRSDLDLPPREILQKVSELQSLCYPRWHVGLNPPLCLLHILNLYSLEVYVQQVLVNWHNQWDVEAGLPMGCDISLSVMMHQYPTREEVLCGASFDSRPFMGKGYSGTFTSGHPNASLECAQELKRQTVASFAAATKASGSSTPFSTSSTSGRSATGGAPT
jgi:hypothetical protein